ncbi:hypothetical protein M9H77_11060 [Catharanthus roseus]|uniref:Uncharacterized protein n=1 Tax=Catharanthus roseus TaxID=4058 RepID=A0ACC0BDG8_CATRO|nr:hypothetical protein M9H77_11060 [Catharanthus roseus]
MDFIIDTDYGVSSSEPFIGRHSADMCFEGSRNKRPDKARDVLAPTQRKKMNRGSFVDPELIPSYGGHLAGSVWHETGSWFIEVPIALQALTGWNLNGSQSAARLAYLHRNLGQASRVDAKELAGCCSLLEAWIYMYFPMFVHAVSIWYGFIAYFDCVVRQFGFGQCICAHPIRPIEAHRPANNWMYVVRNLFVEALWLKAPSHLLTETWTSVSAILPSVCMDDYM